ncbi:hypothetical protein H310_02499 [Aphanomyces invadans]|uniref:HSF-type DNA-binding domain-containing protein n=1 Tax=Aphanomyces invadans TaxID=157072 RepID=A0A024UQM6_9STRA|nr:hypothetical protein H310_02499 [Aphanomyces invadans]ETW08162.1 hypothetical protein H310_02499 [Aphanomyces invadans]|eukprot:XP_008864255.1 hypothetical protein H310_02499 [Aphanomyces invadans]
MKKAAAPMFLQKLFDMLHAIPPSMGGWCHGGSAFEIKSPTDFARVILPQYFKHSKYTSFVRQLNFYGFVKGAKVAETPTSVVFQHDYFHQHKPHLIRRIKRKTNHSTTESDAVDDLRRDVHAIKETLSSMDAQLKQLQEVVKSMVATMTLLEPYQFHSADARARPVGQVNQQLLAEAIEYYMPQSTEDWSHRTSHHAEVPKL